MDPSDMTKMMDMKMTMTMKLDLNNWWIKGELDAPGQMPFKGTMFTTYDATAKKWYRVMVDSMGGSEMSTSMGMKDNKIVWEGDARSPMPGMTAMKTRTTESMAGEGDHDARRGLDGRRQDLGQGLGSELQEVSSPRSDRFAATQRPPARVAVRRRSGPALTAV